MIARGCNRTIQSCRRSPNPRTHGKTYPHRCSTPRHPAGVTFKTSLRWCSPSWNWHLFLRMNSRVIRSCMSSGGKYSAQEMKRHRRCSKSASASPSWEWINDWDTVLCPTIVQLPVKIGVFCWRCCTTLGFVLSLSLYGPWKQYDERKHFTTATFAFISRNSESKPRAVMAHSIKMAAPVKRFKYHVIIIIIIIIIIILNHFIYGRLSWHSRSPYKMHKGKQKTTTWLNSVQEKRVILVPRMQLREQACLNR